MNYTLIKNKPCRIIERQCWNLCIVQVVPP
jgi:hypothetical protein